MARKKLQNRLYMQRGEKCNKEIPRWQIVSYLFLPFPQDNSSRSARKKNSLLAVPMFLSEDLKVLLTIRLPKEQTNSQCCLLCRY